MIVNGKSLLDVEPLRPMLDHKARAHGVSHGLTECGYDIRIAQSVTLFLGRRFVLASSIEKFDMPNWLMGRTANKSTWARKKLDASMTTNIEPGWCGYLTIELNYFGTMPLHIPAGAGILQVFFEKVQNPAEYSGKYQHQPDQPVRAIMEGSNVGS